MHTCAACHDTPARPVKGAGYPILTLCVRCQRDILAEVVAEVVAETVPALEFARS
jgi:hypothetical protein